MARKRRKLTKKRLERKRNREQMLKASINPRTGKTWEGNNSPSHADVAQMAEQ